MIAVQVVGKTDHELVTAKRVCDHLRFGNVLNSLR
jgi:hypothetical protein